jgi:muramoyltetrapeptide carboxypeptidase
MNRRQFSTFLWNGLVVAPFVGCGVNHSLSSASIGKSIDSANMSPKILKPNRLQIGDTIGVIAPSSALPEHVLNRALTNLQNLGFKLKEGKHIRAMRGYLAGTEQQRLEDIHNMFADPTVKGIWCLRGGYGAARLLPDLDFKLIKKNPKVFIGYSDITALHVAIADKTGLVTFHGPVGTSDYNDYTLNHVKNVLMTPVAPYKIELSEENLKKESNLFKTEVISAGKGRGRLTGGNLSLLSSAAGTPFASKSFAGKIVFMEDIDERPYRVDRMLTQLLQSSDLKKAAGIALGVFDGCNPNKDENSLSLMECFQDRLGNLGIPVLYGLSFGHISHQFTLPMGIEAELDTDNKILTFLETAVR